MNLMVIRFCTIFFLVLSPADGEFHIDKNDYEVPFVCGAKDLGEALRRIAEGAAMIRTKGEAGTGDVIHAVKHARTRTIHSQIQATVGMDDNQLRAYDRKLRVMYELLKKTAKLQRLPVVDFSAGGVGGLQFVANRYYYYYYLY